MQPLTAHQGREFSRAWPLDDALLGHDGIDEIRRGYIEYRVEGFDLRRQPLAVHFQQLAAGTLLDGNVIARF